MVRSILRAAALTAILVSASGCVHGFKAGRGVYITSVKISPMPKSGTTLVKAPAISTPPVSAEVVASAAKPAIIR